MKIELDLTLDDLTRIYRAVGMAPTVNDAEIARDTRILDAVLAAIEEIESMVDTAIDTEIDTIVFTEIQE